MGILDQYRQPNQAGMGTAPAQAPAAGMPAGYGTQPAPVAQPNAGYAGPPAPPAGYFGQAPAQPAPAAFGGPSILDQIAAATASHGGGIYLEAIKDPAGVPVSPAIYVVRVESIEIKRGMMGESFVIEVEVVESTNPQIPAGTRAADVQNLTKNPTVAPGNVKAILMAVANCADVDAAGIAAAISPQQPLKGCLAIVEAVPRTSKKSGKTYSNRSWRAVPAQAGAAGAPPF